jgi:hypothetical protein
MFRILWSIFREYILYLIEITPCGSSMVGVRGRCLVAYCGPVVPVSAVLCWALYHVYHHNWRNINTIYIYIYIYITRLESKEIFSPSKKINRKVGRAKNLWTPWYWELRSILFFVWNIKTMKKIQEKRKYKCNIALSEPLESRRILFTPYIWFL